MQFTQTPLPGAYLIDLEKRGDERGFFARQFCAREFAEHGLPAKIAQINNSASAQKHTLRGLHYQLPPHAETKMVRCIRGALLDIILDLRPDSPTFKQWFTAELTAENRRMLLVPKGFAHGFLSLEDDTELFYLTDEFYALAAERGVRYNDPAFNITLPHPPAVISQKDQSWQNYNPAQP